MRSQGWYLSRDRCVCVFDWGFGVTCALFLWVSTASLAAACTSSGPRSAGPVPVWKETEGGGLCSRQVTG